jgi:predicted PurR-regulated permease PerM
MRHDVPQSFPLGTVVGFVAIVAALHLAQAILIPLALAALIALLLSPLVHRLEKWRVPVVAAVGVATAVALLVVVVFAWVLTRQISELADRLPEYRANIVDKASSLGRAGRYVGDAVSSFQRLGEEILESVRPTAPAAAEAQSVRVIDPKVRPLEVVSGVAVTIAKTLGTASIVAVLVIFLLVYRRDVGDRLVQVFGRGSVNLTSQTMVDAAHSVSRYLLLLAIVNGAFGLVMTIGLAILGVPNAILWGLLAAVLRFIPYAGPWAGLLPPFVLSLAVFPSWDRPLALVCGWTVVEIVTANVVEPWVYGSRTVVSPLGVLLGALFWTWLWGPAGLVLAVPLTASVFVLGRSIPRLAFLDTLFGSKTEFDPGMQLYHRLFALDSDAAVALADSFGADKPLVEVCDRLLLPALGLAEIDRHRESLDEDKARSVLDNMRSLLEDLAERRAPQDVPLATNGPRVIVLPAADEADEVVAAMLVECLARAGRVAESASSRDTTEEKVRRAARRPEAVVCISALPPSAAAPARRLARRLRSARPDARIVVGLWSAPDLALVAERMAPRGRTTLVATLSDAVRELGAPDAPTTAADTGAPAPASADRAARS